MAVAAFTVFMLTISQVAGFSAKYSFRFFLGYVSSVWVICCNNLDECFELREIEIKLDGEGRAVEEEVNFIDEEKRRDEKKAP